MSLPACACGHPIPSEAEARRHVKECPGQGLPAGWTLDDYNAAQKRARDAYRSDSLAAQGLCVICGERKPGGFIRTCSKCRKVKTRGKS